MFNRKAVFFAVAGLLASSGYALADNAPKTSKTTLSLNPAVMTADDAAPRAPLMMALDKVGAAKPLDDLGLNIFGFVEAGYTYNHRHHGAEGPILPGPFNHEVGNHFMLNQVDLTFVRTIKDATKFDVGATVEVMYGTDAAGIHSSGMPFNGDDPTTDDSPEARDDRYRANYQFDVTQAFVTVNLPVGANGLQLNIGKFVTPLGIETINPTTNLFYSHSWIFNALPFTQTGIIGTYKINDQWTVSAGVTRGWDMTFEDNGICAIDGVGSIMWQVSPAIKATLNWNVGPQNFADSSHYRTVIDPILSWKVNDNLTLAAEGLYIYDGGLNNEESGNRHAYGDVWGAAVYASYMVNDMFTINARVEKYHSCSDGIGALGDSSDLLNANQGFVEDGTVPSVNVYSFTLGTTITPMPKDPILKNLMIRPEVRYDLSEDRVFNQHGSSFKDQLTFAADVIFKF